jgi:predicted nuclease of predicted toxin-antitoxin system
MRILLDESLPRDLRLLLPQHEVSTVVACGWSGIRNGKLLALAATRFDMFLTADQNIEHQQNLLRLPLPVVVLVAVSNRIESLEPLMPKLQELLTAIKPKTLYRVGDPPATGSTDA